MADKVKVVVRSFLSYDGYECGDRTFGCWEKKELKQYLEGKDVEWVKGLNTFTGKQVSDEFFNLMVRAVEEA